MNARRNDEILGVHEFEMRFGKKADGTT
jgi:hypothetical protein